MGQNEPLRTVDIVPQPYDPIDHYLELTKDTEVPQFFNRWSLTVGLGAWLGKRVWFPFGSGKIYPNMYAMLLGAPGTRKSSAIKGVKRILAHAGYQTFAAEKTTKEKFLLDLAGDVDSSELSLDTFFDMPMFEEGSAECFIAADEFNDFFGNNILDFVSLLGVLWDYEGVYKNKIKNGVSVEIPDPYITILGGNTETTFAHTFPPEVMGQGFFSRMIAVYAEPTRKRVTFPTGIDFDKIPEFFNHMYAMKEVCVGELSMTTGAKALIDKIYRTWKPIEDERFSHYGNRRLNHLIKLIIVHTCCRLSTEITEEDVTRSNTILSHTEHYMPRAFGEFGRAKNSPIAHKALTYIDNHGGIVSFSDLMAHLASDLSDMGQLADVMKNLTVSGKVQTVDGGFLPKKKPLDIRYDKLVNYSYLTKEEIEGE